MRFLTCHMGKMKKKSMRWHQAPCKGRKKPGLWKDRHPSDVTRRVQLLCLDLGGSGPPDLGDGSFWTFSGSELWLKTPKNPWSKCPVHTSRAVIKQRQSLRTPCTFEKCLGPQPGVSAAKRKLLAIGEASKIAPYYGVNFGQVRPDFLGP